MLLFIFVTTLVSGNFDVLPDVLIEHFLVCTPMGEPVVAKRVYRGCSVMIPNRVTLFDLVELEMFDFYIILGMYWHHDCFASLDFRTRVGSFNPQMSPY